MAGLFTEFSLVIARGEMIDGIFHVSELAFPPVELPSETLKLYPNLDLFGLEFIRAVGVYH